MLSFQMYLENIQAYFNVSALSTEVILFIQLMP